MSPDLKESAAKPDRKIALPTKNGYRFVSLSEIIRIEGDSNYSWFHMVNRNKLIISKCLGEFEKMLRNEAFFRTHKKHIVNLKFLASFERGRLSTVVLSDNHQVPLSYHRREQFLELIKTRIIFHGKGNQNL